MGDLDPGAIDHAFVLAAGRGERMRPLTDRVPKPLAVVAGRTLLDRALDHLAAAGVRRAVVNAHHLADVLAAHLAARAEPPHITLSREDALLDTGGGIARARHHFAGRDFFVVAGDALWEGPALTDLAGAWDPARMDILILLQPLRSMASGVGDYALLPDGRAVRSRSKTGTHMFTSLRINRAAIFAGAPARPFSYLALLDQAEVAGRLYGLEHRGTWHHISTMVDIAAAERAL
ncbi:MAG TPA: nucleotidyltransferase family protein [Rhodospirillaceae bacterium]|nr:nucleotidyltransferase family protein [Alphaproteobacteria bacterium]HBH27130.1 nucleotidyltransferase family protein [Rhodospirillaceae bacterium]